MGEAFEIDAQEGLGIEGGQGYGGALAVGYGEGGLRPGLGEERVWRPAAGVDACPTLPADTTHPVAPRESQPDGDEG
jgi:hypothetical protein